MPDPLKTLAPIIEPTAPPDAVPGGHDGAILATGLAFAFLVPLAFLVRRWRRQAPARALRRLARDSADPRAGADALAQLIGGTPAARGEGMASWHAELARLRFGPATAADRETLARLCEEAIASLQAGESGKPRPPHAKR